MKVIQLHKKTNHKTEQMETVIAVLCLVNNIKVSKTEIAVLAYYVVHGVKDSTDNLLISSGITKLDNLRNIKTRLLKLGFLKRVNDLYKSYELNMDQNFTLDTMITLYIKVDNS